MFEAKLRFMGRFVFAELHKGNAPAGVLNVLALNMEYNPAIGAARHQFALTIPRSAVVQPGSRPPDLMVASQEEPDLAEHGVWLLHDHDVVLDGTSTFKWTNRANPKLVGFDELAPGVPLDASALFSRGPVSGTVRLSKGSAEAKQIVKGKSASFVKLSGRDAVDQQKDGETKQESEGKQEAEAIADLVEVTLELSEPHLPVYLTSRAGGPTCAIVINAADSPAMTFTNLCALPHGRPDGLFVDQEFAALYEVLRRPPLPTERLIPKERPRLGYIDDCYNKAYIAYEE